MTYSPLLIANYFIEKSLSSGQIITPMKVVKMVYIAHGWHLAVLGKPLIAESVQAWKYGPVIPSVYHAFKVFGSDPIKAPLTPGNTEYDLIAPQTREILDRVWEAYGQYSALQLSSITHLPNTPWEQIAHKGETIIPDDLILDHYEQLYKNQLRGVSR
jgi:uncharacterized phage-associated protein